MGNSAPVTGSLKVGPVIDDPNPNWQADNAVIQARACLYDDEYKFNADGTFQNVLGTETWVEPWAGADPEACAAPVAPHDGSSTGQWIYDETAQTITIVGVGSYLGLSKVANGYELPAPDQAPGGIVYNIHQAVLVLCLCMLSILTLIAMIQNIGHLNLYKKA